MINKINKIIRGFITLLGLAIGYQVFSLILLSKGLVKIFHLTSVPRMGFKLLGALIFGIIFYFLSSRLIKSSSTIKAWIENRLQKTPMRDILYGFFGLLMGLLVANLFVRAFVSIPWIGGYLPIFANVILGYFGASIALKKKEELSSLLSFPILSNKKDSNVPTVVNSVKPKILDTSVIIDGRIADICKTGFIEGTLVIPNFVLEELRHIADSSDTLKRNRGRRGLDILNKIQKELNIDVDIYEGDFEDINEVDSKLVKLAQVLDGKIITNDFNLNKVAEFQNVQVLNINELSNAVKPVVLPGEEMVVQVIKDGKETGQGVAYLDDGTMIVVDGGKKHIGETIGVIVTSVLQTAAGRMIFARPKTT
jgi:uncharacterized protein YacL